MVPPADLIESRRLELADGLIVQIRIWRLPEATGARLHGLKYSLFFGRKGERIVGCDNETGKGDHCHYRDREERYVFVSMEQLVADFWNDVGKEIGHE